MKKTKITAVTACISSLSICLMILTGLFPFATYALPGIAGFLFSIIVIEINLKYAFLGYFTTSIISLITVADKEAVLIFIFFLGYYPILKSIIEKKCKKFLQILIKFSVFNIGILVSYVILIYFINAQAIISTFSKFNNFALIVLFFIFPNFIFCLYDRAISQCISVYIYKYRDKISNIIK